jgi:hypothetical protein
MGRAARLPSGRFDPSWAAAEFAVPPPPDPSVGGLEVSTAPIDSGDFDGDGYGDLLVPTSQTEQQLFYGGPSAFSGVLDATRADATLSSRSGTMLPFSRVGDVDGDGIDDLQTASGLSFRGIVYGSKQRWSGNVVLAPAFEIAPKDPVDALAGGGIGGLEAGDIDGDGRPDIIAVEIGGYDTGRPGALYIVHGDGQRTTGRIRLNETQIVKSGSLTQRTNKFGSEFMDNDALGSSLAFGDVDGDGSVDVLATAPGTSAPGALEAWSGGTVYLLPGAQTPQ